MAIKEILSYDVKSLVKWGASGTVVFVTKEARLCDIAIGDKLVVSAVKDEEGKAILIRKLPVKLGVKVKS